MALARPYKVGVFDTSTFLATGAAVAATTPIPILYGVTTASSDCNISALRFGCLGAASFPSNASWSAVLAVNTGVQAGGQTAVATQLSGVVRAAATTFKTAGGTSAAAITGLTLTTPLYTHPAIPFTAGANWGEWVTPGFEINVPVSTQFAVFIICSSSGSGTTFGAEIDFTE